MKKYEFLVALSTRLSGLPQEDIKKSIDYYSEMIDDRMEDGLREEAAVAALGSLDEIVSQILKETSLPKLVKESVRKKRAFKPWAIVLLILGAPLWISLLAVAAVIVLSAYVVIWSVVISLYAIDLALAACSVAGVFSTFIYIATGKVAEGMVFLGGGLLCAGLVILFTFVCNQAVKGLFYLSKAIVLGLKRCFVGKEKTV